MPTNKTTASASFAVATAARTATRHAPLIQGGCVSAKEAAIGVAIRQMRACRDARRERSGGRNGIPSGARATR
eukprot:3496261-Prymnesium_polylepis.1